MKKFRRKVLDMLMSNNSGSSLRQQLLDGAPFRSSLLYTAIPQRAASGTTGTFTRATTSTWQNNDGYLVTGVAGEIGFPGARREYNQISNGGSYKSEGAFNSWTKAGVPPTVTDGIAGPDGRLTAARVVFAGSGAGNAIYTVGANGTGRTGIVSAQIRGDAAGTIRLLASNSGAFIDAAVTTEWQRFTIPAFAMTNTDGVAFLRNDVGQLGTIYVADAMIKDVTAQTTQTAGEYVSVGALDYRSTQNPLYYSTPGTAGHYASTPDSVLGSNSPDKIEAKIALVDWSPAVGNIIAGKRSGAGQTTAVFYVAAGGALSLFASLDGTASSINVNSTANVSFPDLRDGYVKYERNESTGVIKFFTSSDGSAWTQLGADVAAAAGALYASTSPWEIGSQLGGTSSNLNGKIYWVTGYSSSTPIFDFNPHRDATTPTGTITSSTTGEVWTINGASSVVRSAAYHGSMVDGVRCFPTDLSGNPIPAATLIGYQAQGARTNLCLQSNAFTTTWVAVGTPSATQNVRGPDGATSAWTLTDNDAAAIEGIFIPAASLTLTAATWTASTFVKKTSGAQTSYPIISLDAGGVIAIATIDTTNGVATAWTAYTAFTIATGLTARCRSFNTDFWRIELSFTATAAGWTFALYPAGTSNATQSSGVVATNVTGSAVFYGAQVELGSFASSYIATTTAAVTRNADALTYSSAGNVSGTVGAAYAEASVFVGATPGRLLTLNNATQVNALYAGGATVITMYDGTATLNGPANSITADGIARKYASTWNATGLKMRVAASGSLGAEGAFDGDMTPNEIRVGSLYLAGNEWNGTVRNVRIWQRALSSSELQAVTS